MYPTEVETPKEMQITFEANYANLFCNDKADAVTSAVFKVAKKEADKLLCGKLMMCRVKRLAVKHCERRQKRDVARSVAFTITVTNMPGTGEICFNISQVQLNLMQ